MPVREKIRMYLPRVRHLFACFLVIYYSLLLSYPTWPPNLQSVLPQSIQESLRESLSPVLLALLPVLLSYYYNIRVSARRTTADVIAKLDLAHEDITEAEEKFKNLTKDGKSELADEPDTDDVNWEGVKQLLDHYEFIAVLIIENAIDEKMYIKWNRNRYVRTWKCSKKYIENRRKKINNRDLYENFQRIAERMGAGQE